MGLTNRHKEKKRVKRPNRIILIVAVGLATSMLIWWGIKAVERFVFMNLPLVGIRVQLPDQLKDGRVSHVFLYDGPWWQFLKVQKLPTSATAVMVVAEERTKMWETKMPSAKANIVFRPLEDGGIKVIPDKPKDWTAHEGSATSPPIYIYIQQNNHFKLSRVYNPRTAQPRRKRPSTQKSPEHLPETSIDTFKLLSRGLGGLRGEFISYEDSWKLVLINLGEEWDIIKCTTPEGQPAKIGDWSRLPFNLKPTRDFKKRYF